MIHAASTGVHKLLYGTYAARRFCAHTGCINSPMAIIQQLLDVNTRAEAMVFVLQSGLEAYAASLREPFLLTDYEVTVIYDAVTEPEGAAISNAFIGAVANKSLEEVPIYLDELRLALEKVIQDVQQEAEVTRQAPDSSKGSKTKSIATQ